MKTAIDVHRSEQGSLPESVVAAIFRQPADGVGSAATPDGRVVFKITSDRTPPVDFADARVKAMATELDTATRESLLDQYVSALRRALGVSIHQDVAVTPRAPTVETPVSLLKLARGRGRGDTLLEVVEAAAAGRYLEIGLDTGLIFRSSRLSSGRSAAARRPTCFAPASTRSMREALPAASDDGDPARAAVDAAVGCTLSSPALATRSTRCERSSPNRALRCRAACRRCRRACSAISVTTW